MRTPFRRRDRAARHLDGRDEDGVVTAFVIVIVSALILMTGLVLDGGLALAAKVQAIDGAEAAARAGAQAIDLPTYRSTGQITLDAATATADAEQALATSGETGTVAVDGDVVTVTVTITQHTQILDLIGIDSLHETATGSATAEQEAP
jgi:Flp pilus assembly protein TadG